VTGEPLRPHFQRQSQSHAIEPRAHRVAAADGSRAPSQKEECSLKYIFGVVFVQKYAPGNSEHHWSMATHQCRERFLVTSRNETIQN
jgi:hypothetical protein